MTTMNPMTERPPRVYEPEDLLRLRNGKLYELVDGKLVRRKMGSEAGAIAGQILFLIKLFIRGKGLGRVIGAEGSYQCFPRHPKKVRRPDVSYIRAGRLPGGKVPRGHILVPPDLAVEVVSPRDLVVELDEKLVEYRDVGVPLLWVVHPATRRVQVYRPSSPTPAVELQESDTISGEEVIPGFSCKVAEFFEED